MRAAVDFGFHAECFKRMSCDMLQEVGNAILLHVKSNAAARHYDHWLLYMGEENGHIHVYDGPVASEINSYDDLLAIWDGLGIIISNAPISLLRQQSLVITQVVMYFGALLISILALVIARNHRLVFVFQSRHPTLMRTGVPQAILLILIALMFECVFRLSHRGGYLSSVHAINIIKESHFASFLPKVSAAELRDLLHQSDVILIDARLKHEFEGGHIKQAVNIPFNSSLVECKSLMGGTDHLIVRVVIYCHSNDCHYSHVLARKLNSIGYQNISLFRGGWVEWSDHQEK